MKELELKDIVGHLPFGLKCKILNHKCDYVGIEKSVVNGYYYIGSQLHLTYAGGSVGKVPNKEIEIYLHPFDSIAKKIKVDGVTIIPIVELSKIAFFKTRHHNLTSDHVELGVGYTFHLLNNSDGLSFSCKRGYTGKLWDYECFVPNQQELFQKLNELQIDTLGLIPKGLAKDINTL